MKKGILFLGCIVFAIPINKLQASTVSVVNRSGYKLLLSIAEKQHDGPPVIFRRTLEPLNSEGGNRADYFMGDRDKIVGISIARYGEWYGIHAKPKIIPDEDLLKYPGFSITINIDYSAMQQISKKAWAVFGYKEKGGTTIDVVRSNFDDYYQYPQFSSWLGWLTASSDWFTNLVDYLPGARRYSRSIERVPAYRIFGVPQKYSPADVDNAYIALMKKWNPDRFQDKHQKIFAWRMIELFDQAYENIAGETGRVLLQEAIQKPEFEEIERPIVYNFLLSSQDPQEDLPELDDAALNAAAAETARKLAEIFKKK